MNFADGYGFSSDPGLGSVLPVVAREQTETNEAAGMLGEDFEDRNPTRNTGAAKPGGPPCALFLPP